MTFLKESQKKLIESTEIINTKRFYTAGLWDDDHNISLENGNILRRINTLTGRGDIPIMSQKHNDHVFSLLENAIARREKHLAVAVENLRKNTMRGK